MRQPRFVETNAHRKCVLLCNFGQSIKSIATETGLTEGQVRTHLYARNRGRIKSYRNGDNSFSARINQSIRRLTTDQLRLQVRLGPLSLAQNSLTSRPRGNRR